MTLQHSVKRCTLCGLIYHKKNKLQIQNARICIFILQTIILQTSPMPPPNRNSHGYKRQQAHACQRPRRYCYRDCHIEQPETGKKRQEQHCRYNEFPTLQFLGSLLN